MYLLKQKHKRYLHIYFCMKIYIHMNFKNRRGTHLTVMVLFLGRAIGVQDCSGYYRVLSRCLSLEPGHFAQLPGMLCADSLDRVPLQALSSSACRCIAKFKPLLGDRLNPMTGFMQYKCMSPLPQFGTVLKGHTSELSKVLGSLCCNCNCFAA